MDDLSKLLANWEPEVPESPAFRRQVWQRIAAAEARSKSGFAASVVSFLIFVSRPRVAVAAACGAVLLGLAIGGRLSLRSDAGAAAYLRSVNPYAQAGSRT